MRLIGFVLVATIAGLNVSSAPAQEHKPAARAVAAIRDCAAANKDDLDAGERQCLFKLVAEPCLAKATSGSTETNCYDGEAAIWDALLNDNYKRLLDQLDAEQTAKAKAMQRAWVAYRDTTCGFYDDKIRGTMSNMMHAACVARETARRAMLLDFFGRL